MKIGIDARICDEGWYYAAYVCELVETFCEQRTEDEIVVYRSKKAQISWRLSRLKNVTQKNLSSHRSSLFGESHIGKLFGKEDFALMIFFDHHIPQW